MSDRRKTASWETEIKRIMRHFCMKEEAKQVIAEVKATANGTESDDLLYERAWSKFKSILIAS
jgi:hypothetical protein